MVKPRISRSKRHGRSSEGVNYKERCASCGKKRVIKRHKCSGRRDKK